MSIKKKLGLGAASAVLGLSLVVGGTWAAFNDVATIKNHFAAGTLDLAVGKHDSKPINFDLGNMKPGESVQRTFQLNNAGSLAIKEVLLKTTAANFFDPKGDSGQNGQKDFLSQFEVNFMKGDLENGILNLIDPGMIISGSNLTLADLAYDEYSGKIKGLYLVDGKINLAPLLVANLSKAGIPVGDSDYVAIKITFKNNTTDKTPTGEYVQNIYQGDTVDFFFNLEATQWGGVDVGSGDGNGSINNGVVPSPLMQKTVGTPSVPDNQVVND